MLLPRRKGWCICWPAIRSRRRRVKRGRRRYDHRRFAPRARRSSRVRPKGVEICQPRSLIRSEVEDISAFSHRQQRDGRRQVESECGEVGDQREQQLRLQALRASSVDPSAKPSPHAGYPKRIYTWVNPSFLLDSLRSDLLSPCHPLVIRGHPCEIRPGSPCSRVTSAGPVRIG